jgi:ATP-dependent Lon protease
MARTTKPKNELPASQLRWTCDPKSLGVSTTDDVKPSREIIGQDRALRALRLGLEMKHAGYNLFVTGFSGTGRLTTIKRLLTEFKASASHLKDRCYVHNFSNNDQPILLTLPAGKGSEFRDDMDQLVQDLVKNVPAAFDRKRFKEERKRMMEHFQERQQSVLKDFEHRVKERGFEVVQVQVGSGMRPDITPVINNVPVNFDQLDGMMKEGKLSREQVEQMLKDRMNLEGQMELVFRELRNIERKAKESLSDLESRFILPIVKEIVDEVRAKYDDEKLRSFLDEVQENILTDLGRFRPADEQQPMIPGVQPQEEDDFVEFQVNVLVDNGGATGAPVVIETNPRFKNIFGTIEREIDRNGVWRTDFTLIKAGSLLKADGGFLVVNALDALVEPGVWQTLKRTLRHGLLEIQPLETGVFGASSALKPEPVKLDVKVIMLGDAEVYSLLYEQDDDFKKIFKVRADFDTEMAKEPVTVKKYLSFVKMVCDEEHLLPFDRSALAAIVEHGVRLAGRQNKLSTRFNVVADIAREANYWAKSDKRSTITAGDVLTALDEKIERVNLAEQKMREMLEDRTIMIDTEGSVTGQVNGLTVYDLHEYAFGLPARVTAKTSIGRAGIIDIEREIAMSGPSHSKGVLIISGYLHALYAQTKPLTMNASITFEQNYGGVDGDSASSTEIYAILSSLAGIGVRQEIAVTGSVNQNGEIQPIGGVNQKIEGFFALCRARGLTGTQGVIIPHQNKQDLMLRHDVVDAVAKGQFHIYAIKSIDEGLEILTGMRAGRRNADGTFEKGTVHHLVNDTLTKFARHWRELTA